jgi:hypothetical protein
MKNEAGYLKPLGVYSLGAAGTRVVGPFVTVVRITCATSTVATFSGTGAAVPVVANFPEYFRVTPGETITATAALVVTEMA